MTLDYRWPDDIDPDDVEGIAEACESAAVERARLGGYFTADDLRSAARLLRLLVDSTPGRRTAMPSETRAKRLREQRAEAEAALAVMRAAGLVCTHDYGLDERCPQCDKYAASEARP